MADEEHDETKAEDAAVDVQDADSQNTGDDAGDDAGSGEPEAAEKPSEAKPSSGASAPLGDSKDDAPLTRKQIRKLERSKSEGPARPQRSVEERVSERAERHAAAAAARKRTRARGREKASGEKGSGTPPAERSGAPGKVRTGTVVSDRADKTITVRIERASRHPTYEKIVRRSNTLHAHDETNDAREGDVVRIVETRPLSRTKRWRLVEVVERAQ